MTDWFLGIFSTLGRVTGLFPIKTLIVLLAFLLFIDSIIFTVKSILRNHKSSSYSLFFVYLLNIYLLASFAFVDAVVLFDDETPLELISQINPDVLVKGGDYSVDEIVGNELVSSAGGQVLTVPFVKGFSSTNFIDKIINEANG